jgi:dihydroorotase
MELSPSLVLQNVSLPDGRVADVTIVEGTVRHIGEGTVAERVIDCTGLFVLPAAVDMHVHMRGGQQSEKEDWESGSKSALAGGVTVVVDQPNTVPPITTPEALRARVRDAAVHALCHFAINSGVTRDTGIRTMWRAGAMAFGEIFFAPSSYGEAVTWPELSAGFAAIRSLGGLATVHAEAMGSGADSTLDTHRRIRSCGGELRAVREVVRANTAGCRLHFCHLSTALSVDAAEGSIEATPHHLFLSCETFRDTDAFYKVNPPLRSEKERKELLSRWKRIDVIASDHAPHTRVQKRLPFPEAPSGLPGVETMVPLLLAEVLKKTVGLPEVIAKTSTNPAAILGIPPAGFAPGCRGDFALYPKQAVRIGADNLHSRCGWTPYEGLFGVFPQQVIMGGLVAYEGGEFFRAGPSWIPGKGYPRH